MEKCGGVFVSVVYIKQTKPITNWLMEKLYCVFVRFMENVSYNLDPDPNNISV
jgi:hypothetical protein